MSNVILRHPLFPVMFSNRASVITIPSLFTNSLRTSLACLGRKMTTSSQQEEQPSTLFRHFKTKILATGPITIAEYMKEILISPSAGYYMHADVFGEKGDFTTSPEISQLFGEMLAVWLISEREKIGNPKPFQIIELGPGRGTMLDDILRVFRKFNLTKDLTISLVEVSSHLSKLQAKRLCRTCETCDSSVEIHYQKGETEDSVPVFWYSSLQDVPHQFSLVLAHEFFDALPIHKFRRTENGWREILVDLDHSEEDKLKFVISRNATPACQFIKPSETRDHLEVSPESGVIIDMLATRLKEKGGIALVVDYGHDGDGEDTFRAYRKHKQIHPLDSPGSADLTADVDFSYLKSSAGEGRVINFGPVTQRDFLLSMGINIRFEMVKANCKNESDVKALETGLRMLTDEDQMGSRFKFLSFFPAVLKDYLKRNPGRTSKLTRNNPVAKVCNSSIGCNIHGQYLSDSLGGLILKNQICTPTRLPAV